MITRLEDFHAYNRAMVLGEAIWRLVQQWDKFSKFTMGMQLVKSSDSISANLSEGLGRFFVKETKQFGYYSRGSLFETKTWLQKAKNRNLIDAEAFADLLSQLELVGKMINGYINSLGKYLDHPTATVPGSTRKPQAPGPNT